MMLWKNSDTLYPAELVQISEYLSQFDTENYSLRAGLSFNPINDVVGATVIYHVINNFTGLIEFQGAYLPSCIQNVRELDKAMHGLMPDKMTTDSSDTTRGITRIIQ